jgi:DNA-binding XRE family transcriptional regulator
MSSVNTPDFNTVILKKQKTPITSYKPRVVPLEEKLDTDHFQVKHYESAWIQKLIRYRTTRSWKQDDFANKLGISMNVYKQIESNMMAYDPKMVETINNKMQKLEKQYPIFNK